MNRLAILRDLAEEAVKTPDTYTSDPVALAEMRNEFLVHADGFAVAILGTDAADALDWDYDEDAPEDIEQASARLADRTRLQFRRDHDKEVTTFQLIRDCVCCGVTTTVDVSALADLAGHLNDECRWTE